MEIKSEEIIPVKQTKSNTYISKKYLYEVITNYFILKFDQFIEKRNSVEV